MNKMLYKIFAIEVILTLSVCFVGGVRVSADTQVNPYAKEVEDEYEYDTSIITFNANGGSCLMRTKVVQKGAVYGELPIAELTGCDFDGWYSDKDGGDKITQDSVVPADSDDITLYARFTSRPGTWKIEGNLRSYLGEDGKTVRNDKRYIDGYWYYFDSDGVAYTGWMEYSGNKYYFDYTGKMVTGWRRYNGCWYYFHEYPYGKMATGFTQINDKWYFFDSEGRRRNRWLKFGYNVYYFDLAGIMQTGWQEIGKNTYHFDEVTGRASYGWTKIEGKLYYFNEKYELVRDEYVGDCYVDNNGCYDSTK